MASALDATTSSCRVSHTCRVTQLLGTADWAEHELPDACSL